MGRLFAAQRFALDCFLPDPCHHLGLKLGITSREEWSRFPSCACVYFVLSYLSPSVDVFVFFSGLGAEASVSLAYYSVLCP